MQNALLFIIILQFVGFFVFARYMKIMDTEFKLLHKRFDELKNNS